MGSRERLEAMEQIFSGKVVLRFFAGWILLGLMTSAAYALLTYWFGDRWPVLAVIFVSSLLVLIGIVLSLERQIRKRLSVDISAQIGEDTKAASHRVLVVLVSSGTMANQKTTHESAIDYQLTPELPGPRLEHVWYVFTPEGEVAGRALLKDYPQLRFHDVHIRSAWDAQAAYTGVLEAIDQALRAQYDPPITRNDVIVDITPGTKPMTTGAVLACLDQEVAVQYLYTQRGPDGQPVQGGRSIGMKVDLHRGETKEEEGMEAMAYTNANGQDH